MFFKKLGNTSVEIPAIGQGTYGAGSYSAATCGQVEKRIDVLRFGIELGMTFLDTAESYEAGHAEEITGKAIKGIRDKVFISTKFEPTNNSYSGIMRSIEGSLRRLGMDYIDLYQIHWPNPSIPIGETMSALTKLVEQGKIRFVGVSNFTSDEFEEAQSFFDEGKIVSNQVEYNLYHRSVESDFIPFSEKNQITAIAYSPFNQGNFALDEVKMQFLDDLSKKYNLTIFQTILNWIISHPTVVTIPQTMSFHHAKDNASAADFKLREEDIEEINRVFKQEPILVEIDRIRVINYDVDDTHPIYTTLEEAIENRLNIQPSPMDLAKHIINGKFLKPVELIRTTDRTGLYDYDLIHGRIRFWAWVIAYKGEKPIPAIIEEFRIGES